MILRYLISTSLSLLLLIFACSERKSKSESHTATGKNTDMRTYTMFKKLSPTETGITFENHITEDDQTNFFTYHHLYDGGGIGVGDIDNDQFPDLFFAGNQADNKLFRNKGGMHFEDITAESGLMQGGKGWSTGVTMVDINADGWLDIYVCRAGLSQVDSQRANQLFINNKDATFSERAAEYGVGDTGHSSHAYFFDFDKDNDLDLLVLNHHPRFSFKPDNQSEGHTSDPEYSDQLYRNEGNGSFRNISGQAGIGGGSLGIAASIGDVNGDGWVDIYFSGNPTASPSAYINQGDGTFSKSSGDVESGSIVVALGSDMADINNDGLRDIVVNHLIINRISNTKKRTTVDKGNDAADSQISEREYTFLAHELHLNRGNGYYSTISNMAGIAVNSLSWAPLMADFDLDGWKDLFATNGMLRNFANDDFNQTLKKKLGNKETVNTVGLSQIIPSEPLASAIYRNTQDLTFENRQMEWGFQRPDQSNGSVYADLDMDGDLDIVTNAMNDTAGVWENEASSSRLFWIEVTINGPEQNIQGVGTRVKVTSRDREQIREYYPNRGLMSSIATPFFFGMGNDRGPYNIEVTWPDGKVSVVDDVRPRDRIMVNHLGSREAEPEKISVSDRIFSETAPSFLGLDYKHAEKIYVGPRKHDPLANLHSTLGPAMAKGDVNGDGLEDLFLGGARGESGVLFVQDGRGKFQRSASNPWAEDAACEDVGALFFDANNDGQLDLYIASGGIDFKAGSENYQDRLYLNRDGIFTRTNNGLPTFRSSTMSIAVADIDSDGDQDLFVGGRILPGNYPQSPESRLFRNEKGVFVDVTSKALRHCGMVTDAVFTDYDRDGDRDLIVTGELMGIHFYKNEEGNMVEDLRLKSWKDKFGLWKSICAFDVNNDGNEDVLLGNEGLNGFYADGSRSHLQTLNIKDSDTGEKQDSLSIQFKHDLSHAVLINEGDEYRMEKLPNGIQISPLMRAIPIDIEEDGILEIVGAGNIYGSDEVFGSSVKGMGFILRNMDNAWQSIPPEKTGFYAEGNVRNLCILRTSDKVDWFILVQNNGPLKIFRIQKKLNSI